MFICYTLHDAYMFLLGAGWGGGGVGVWFGRFRGGGVGGGVIKFLQSVHLGRRSA